MAAISHFNQFVWRTLRRMRFPEVLFIVLSLAILYAIFFPEVQWVADGSTQFPVKVLVFDAATAKPVAGARVAIRHAYLSAGDTNFLDDFRKQFPTGIFDDVKETDRGQTAADGSVIVHYQFRTSASNNNPAGTAILRWAWVAVEADGYGGVVVPARHESMPITVLRERQELLVPIGLMLAK